MTLMPFPSGGLFTAIFLAEGFSFQSLTEMTIGLNKTISADPALSTRLISLTPAANKSGELQRINIFVIEIGPCLPKHNSRLIKL
jgi:hypothetical protein